MSVNFGKRAGEREAQLIRDLLKKPEFANASTNQLALKANVSWIFANKIRLELRRGHNGSYRDTRGRHQPARRQWSERPFRSDDLHRRLVGEIQSYLARRQTPESAAIKKVLRAVGETIAQQLDEPK